MIVAMRAMRNGAGEETRPIVDRALAKLEAAAAAGPAPTTIDPGADGVDPDALVAGDAAAAGDRAAAAGAADLLRAGPRRGVRPGGRPARRGDLGWTHLPRRLVPQRRGPEAVPARPDRRRRGAGHAHRHPAPCSARPGRGHLRPLRRHHAGHAAARAGRALGGGVLPGRGGAARSAGERWRWTSWSPTGAGSAGSCCGWPRTPQVLEPREFATDFTAAARAALDLYS